MLLSLLPSKAALAGTCYVNNTAASGAQGTLLQKLFNQPGCTHSYCDGTCNIIKFNVSGIIYVPGQIVIGPNVTIEGDNKVTLRPTYNFLQNVTDGCFVRMVPNLNNVNDIGAGSGNSVLGDINIDVYHRTDNGVCVYSSGNTLNNIEVKGADDSGISIKGNNNLVNQSSIRNNVEGIEVVDGNFNKISMTEFENNNGIGIDIVGSGNQNILTPTDLRVMGDFGQYLIMGEVDLAANRIEVFDVDADNREGKRYINYFTMGDFNNSVLKTSVVGGKRVFAQLISGDGWNLSSTDITMTATDNEGNTSEFAYKASWVNMDPADCFDDVDLATFSNNPNGTFCNFGNEPPPPPPDDCPEGDSDGDGICDSIDNCVDVANAGQLNLDGDLFGDMCDKTFDTCDDYFEIYSDSSAPQEESDEAGEIFIDCCGQDEHRDDDACKNTACICLFLLGAIFGDDDHDGVFNSKDNCKSVVNGPCLGKDNQADWDGDGVGDVCDNCPSVANPGQEDTYGNTMAGDACDDDRDGDGVVNIADNCPAIDNSDQEDSDQNGIGNACQLVVNFDNINNIDDIDSSIAEFLESKEEFSGGGGNGGCSLLAGPVKQAPSVLFMMTGLIVLFLIIRRRRSWHLTVHNCYSIDEVTNGDSFNNNIGRSRSVIFTN